MAPILAFQRLFSAGILKSITGIGLALEICPGDGFFRFPSPNVSNFTAMTSLPRSLPRPNPFAPISNCVCIASVSTPEYKGKGRQHRLGYTDRTAADSAYLH